MRQIINNATYHGACLQAGLDLAVANTLIAQHLDKKPSTRTPQITHMLGVPAAGKSTYIAQHKLATPQTVLVSFDSVLEQLTPYQADLATHGAQYAFEKWELCARSIGYELLFQALEKRCDILFDHSGARPDHVALLQHAKQQLGYGITVIVLDVDDQTALARAASRSRHLPQAYITERRQALEALLPSYRALADNFIEA